MRCCLSWVKSVLLLLVLLSSWPQAEAFQQYPTNLKMERLRHQMVAKVTTYRHPGATVYDQAVLDAMRAVPRHLFVPKPQQSDAYRDSPIRIGYGQTISQPYIVALMTQLAEVEPGMKVLEVGTGSGYQAAILAELTNSVYTIEIISQLAKRTASVFKNLGLEQIEHRHGDGYYGWPEPMLFDRILVTAAAAHIPSPLLQQLKPGGRMVIPIGPIWGSQELLLLTKSSEGKVITRSIIPVLFVPLTGAGQGNK